MSAYIKSNESKLLQGLSLRVPGGDGAFKGYLRCAAAATGPESQRLPHNQAFVTHRHAPPLHRYWKWRFNKSRETLIQRNSNLSCGACPLAPTPFPVLLTAAISNHLGEPALVGMEIASWECSDCLRSVVVFVHLSSSPASHSSLSTT